MSTQRTGTGNGIAQPISTDEWLANGGLQEIAQEIVSTANLTNRLVTVVEKLTDRIGALESPDTVHDPLPADFDLDDELNITDKGKAELGLPGPTSPSNDIDLDEQVEEEKEETVSTTQLVKTRQPISPTSADEELRVTIPQQQLLQALKVVSKAVARNGINPLLNCIKLSIGDMKMTLTGTDGETWIEQQLSVEATGSDEVLVPAKLFMETVKALPKGASLTLDFYDKALHIEEGGSACSVATKNAEDFPELPRYDDAFLTSISTSTLKNLLGSTLFAAVNESSTGAVHYTNGVFLNFDGNQLDVVATDGHRLVLNRHKGLGSSQVKSSLLIPASVAKYLHQLLPDDEQLAVSIYELRKQFIMETPAFTTGKRTLKRHPATLIASKLIDVKFPDYERVIPKDIVAKAYVHNDDLTAALKRISLVCKQKDQNPVCHIETVKCKMIIKADAGELGEAVETLDCEGGQISIALNPDYLLDVLKVMDGDQVILSWIDENNPVSVTMPRNPDFIYIVMPIRLD